MERNDEFSIKWKIATTSWLGSGKVLTNIAKRMSNQIHSFNIETLEDFKEKFSNFS